LEDYLVELTDIGTVRPQNADDYVRALSRKLDIGIRVIRIDTAADRDLEVRLGHASQVAEMLYDAETGEVSIFIPSSVYEDGFLYFKILYHELAHLSAGHPVPVAGAPDHLWWPAKRLARKPPTDDLARNEVEADLRAEWSLMFCILGRKIYDRERHFSAF
jgi:hypothetical protein